MKLVNQGNQAEELVARSALHRHTPALRGVHLVVLRHLRTPVKTINRRRGEETASKRRAYESQRGLPPPTTLEKDGSHSRGARHLQESGQHREANKCCIAVSCGTLAQQHLVPRRSQTRSNRNALYVFSSDAFCPLASREETAVGKLGTTAPLGMNAQQQPKFTARSHSFFCSMYWYTRKSLQ